MLRKEQLKRVERVLCRAPNLDLDLPILPGEYADRWARVQAGMASRGIDVGLFYWYREMPGDGLYLTGYNPTIERACGLIGRSGRPLLVAGPEAGEYAKEVAREIGIDVVYAEEFQIPDEYYEVADYVPLREAVSRVAPTRSATVGLLTDASIIPARLIDAFRALSAAEIVHAPDILAEMRYEKSPAELNLMRQADVASEWGLRAALAALEPGAREHEVAAAADFAMKAMGATCYGFETIVNSGHRCRTVLGPASTKAIEGGEIVQVGASAGVHGYKGACRRACVMGDRSPLQKDYFQHLNRAFQLSEEKLRAVVEGNLEPRMVDLAARDYFAGVTIAGVNMKRCMTYSSVHGTGLTECLEGKPATPHTREPFGHSIGIMLDVASYGHPNDEICGGCVENAYAKEGSRLFPLTGIPVDVQGLVGSGA